MSDLLQSLGIDREDLEWQDLGLCGGYPIEKGKPKSDIFYEGYESDSQVARAADEMCLRCPVMKQCAMAGMKGETGLWGGIYWNGNGVPDKNRNAHKDEETWTKVRERML